MAEFANGAQGVMAGFFPASHAARRTERPQVSSKDERLCDCLPLTPRLRRGGTRFCNGAASMAGTSDGNGSTNNGQTSLPTKSGRDRTLLQIKRFAGLWRGSRRPI